MADVDLMDPVFQELPESRAILDFLRTLSLSWSDLDHDLTDAEWTAFRALAKRGAVEGILRFTIVPAEPPRRVVEYLRVRGDCTSTEAGDPIPAGAAVDVHLVRVRLTGRGKRWADYLAAEGRLDAVRARGTVLTLLWNAPAVPGVMTKVPPPVGAAVLKPEAPAPTGPVDVTAPRAAPPDGGPNRPVRAQWPVDRTEEAVQDYLQRHKTTYRRLGQACLDGRRGAAKEFSDLFGPTAVARAINDTLGITDPRARCRKQDVSRTPTYQAYIRPLLVSPPRRPEGWVAPDDDGAPAQDILDDIHGTQQP